MDIEAFIQGKKCGCGVDLASSGYACTWEQGAKEPKTVTCLDCAE